MSALGILKIIKSPYDDIIVELPTQILKDYPLFKKIGKNYKKVYIMAYISNFLNQEGKKIKEIKEIYYLPIIQRIVSVFWIDVSKFHINEGIPINYYITLIIDKIIIEDINRHIQIYPGELKIIETDETPKSFIDKLKENIKYYEKIRQEIEIIGSMYKIGSLNIVVDLSEALKKFYNQDYDGSIKDFRKIIEILKNYIYNNEISGMTKNRIKKLRRFISKFYDLISNFGLHAGTYASEKEAIFTKDITLAICRYISSYLNENNFK